MDIPEEVRRAVVERAIREICQDPLKVAMGYHSLYHEKTHQQQDLEMAITFYKRALNSPIGDTKYQLDTANSLGVAFKDLYEQLGTLNHLEEAITCFSQAVDLCPLDHPKRWMYVNDFASNLWTIYEQLGDPEDLKNAITYYKLALDLPGHSNKISSLNGLGNALRTRHGQFGDLEDLEGAITCYKQGLNLCTPGNPARPLILNNFAGVLVVKFEQLGKMEDLERAVTLNEQALGLCPPGDTLIPLCLTGIAIILHIRYKQLGNMEDLEKSVTCNKQALDLTPLGHHLRPGCLSNLANALHARHDKLGGMDDLEKAITLNEQALELCPVNHYLRVSYLNNLAIVLYTRFKQLKVLEDLERAITLYDQAFGLYPEGHPFREANLKNLAGALTDRYDQLGHKKDLEEAMTYNEQALDLCPPGHPGRSMSLGNLANILHTKYELLGRMEDLEKAIAYREEALDLRPPGHSDRLLTSNNLANGLWARYQKLGEMEDLEKAILLNEQALDLCLPEYPERSMYLNNLGLMHYSKYKTFGNQEYLEKAMAYHKQAASILSSLPNRLYSTRHWAKIAHKHGFSSAISAYSLSLDLLQQHLALLPSITSKQKIVEKSSGLILDAASCAISTGKPEMAVQLLEQGRSILWSKIQEYRQPLEDIAQKAPQLAKEFETISKQLEHNATSGGQDITLQHTLSDKWTALLVEIRKLDGFSDYLQATPFKVLKNASAEGPVIMVNISQYGSDAIILISHGPPVVVPLHDVSPQMLYKLVKDLSSATTRSDSPQTVPTVLQKLWNTVVGPVVEQLAELGVPEKSRIWWCPTSYLCALPLHAAGPYRRGSKNLPDLYISSYTPTLTSLIRARSNMPKAQSVPTLLIVSQPDDTIPQVFEETTAIKGIGVQVNSYSEHEADKQGVVGALQAHSWVHFACHGHLEDQPFNSWFQLHNGEHLTVLDLAKAELPNAEFAFLSACHSAAGKVHGTLDESIHLAGALQFSGFRSVVGTLWAMVDDDGPPMANVFYKHIFRNPGNVDLRDAAVALNVATKEMRRNKVPVDRWINFVHIGV